ncbi:MAG: cyclase family protein [Acidimicrobiales bacterium]
MTGPERFRQIARAVNNWGRWGADDQRGTLNLIDDAAHRRAASSVKTGQAFALGLPLSAHEGIQSGIVPGRVNPQRSMVQVNEPLSADPRWIAASEDVVTMALQAATHWDALAHVSYDGRLYNGHPASSVTEHGAARCGIGTVGTIVTRGVLLDVARASGVEVLDPGYAVTDEDLEATRAAHGVEIHPGDAVLVRTGQMAHLAGERTKKKLLAYAFPAPGLGMSSALFFRSHDVAAVAIDTLALDAIPGEDDTVFLPVHLLHLVEMGLTQGQNFVLDELASACASVGVWDFFLDATPLPFTHALGSPVQPVAIL